MTTNLLHPYSNTKRNKVACKVLGPLKGLMWRFWNDWFVGRAVWAELDACERGSQPACRSCADLLKESFYQILMNQKFPIRTLRPDVLPRVVKGHIRPYQLSPVLGALQHVGGQGFCHLAQTDIFVHDVACWFLFGRKNERSTGQTIDRAPLTHRLWSGSRMRHEVGLGPRHMAAGRGLTLSLSRQTHNIVMGISPGPQIL